MLSEKPNPSKERTAPGEAVSAARFKREYMLSL